MPCTTILVGKKASYDGSTMIARNDDSPSGQFTPKKFVVVHPEEQPKKYKSVLSHVEIDLPEDPMRYTAVPNALDGEGIWAAHGINAAGVGMTATETITSNARVLGADPLVEYVPAKDGMEEISGGHHWIARRVPDDAYVVMPNQFGIDAFDLEDALTEQKEHMCSADLKEFIEKNHLDLSQDGNFSARDAFGSHDDSDHVYNTARAWYMLRTLNPRTKVWDGPNAEYTPFSDDLPWCMVPEKKITVEDVKYVLSSHYQGTPYDPYASYGDKTMCGAYRSIGINRNDVMTLIQMRPEGEPIQWLAFASNAFNVLAPFYTDMDTTPGYLSGTNGKVSTENFYWMSRMIAAMADASYSKSVFHIERYQEKVAAKSHEILNRYDTLLEQETDEETRKKLQEEANEKIAGMLQCAAADTLDKVLYELSGQMKNAYARSDA